MNEQILQTKRIKQLKQLDNPGLAGPILTQIKEMLEDAEDRAPVLLERDTMPIQVSRELLAAERITNRMRKTCMSARAKHYVSRETPIPFEYKRAARLSRSSISQIIKWLRRAIVMLKKNKRDFHRPAITRMKNSDEKRYQIVVGLLYHKQAELEKAIEALKLETCNRINLKSATV